MNFGFTQEQLELKELVSKFVEREIKPIALTMDKENKITAMLSKPKTRKGNVWPLDKWSKKV